ncbi:MAG: glycoside hydrolase family 2 TIM barrel-domain containing protein [Bacteroidota bacterium]
MSNIQFKTVLLSLFTLYFFGSLSAQVTVEKVAEKWTFLVDGSPFEVNGATFGYDEDVANYEQYFKELKYLGVNTIRTWGTTEHTKKLLDAAATQDIKVMLGIWMRHGRPGMEADDSFDYLNDSAGKEAMYKNAIDIVNQYKEHPAILTWGVGNEVYLNIATDEEKFAYSQLLEKVCSQIKKTDPNHPVTSVEAWTFGLDWWPKYVPSIDVYGINTYGGGASILPEEFAKKGVDKPYVITEFGVTGEWDLKEDQNGVIPEPTDAEKYDVIVKGYNEWVKPKANCLGLYVFHYASDDKHMAPWLLTHFRGMTRPQYWAIREAYTGRLPENHVPDITTFQLTLNESESEKWIPVQLTVSDKENESLNVNFYYNHRKGSRIRKDQMLPINARGNLTDGFEIQLPRVSGGIKIYVAVHDIFKNVGIATTSIKVIDEEEAKQRFLLPKAELPFYVYQDNENLPYVMSAYMGNFKDLSVDLDHSETVKEGKTAIRISYQAKDNWYGIGFVDPANDWGEILGGYDIRGAKTLSFWAKSSYYNQRVKVGFGLIEKDKAFPDSAIKLREVMLTEKWKKYTIKIRKEDMSHIRSGFVLFTEGVGMSQQIFLDEIVFE